MNLMELHSSRKVKTTRFEMDQVKIEALEKENDKLKKDLQKARQNNRNLYRISVEYKRICEEEQKKIQILTQEINQLNQSIFCQNDYLGRFDSNFQIVNNNKLENLTQKLKTFSGKFSGQKSIHEIFSDKVFSSGIKWSDLDKIIIKLLKLIEDWIPLVHRTDHKKALSLDYRAKNPLFMKNSQKIIIKRPPAFSDIVTDVEEQYPKIRYSDTFENFCATTRSNKSSNTSFGNTRVKVYRREKSLI